MSGAPAGGAPSGGTSGVRSVALRWSAEGKPDVALAFELAGARTTVSVTVGGRRTEHAVERARLQAWVARLADARLSPLPARAPLGAATGSELTLSGELAEATFRWVSTPPAGWEPLAAAMEELLALARELRPELAS